MRRIKIGDVFTIKVPHGYKIYQWAYDVPKRGKYIRVFDGLYGTVPDNISDIVSGLHSYISDFDVRKAYRIGLAEYLGNYPVPDEYPFPDYMLGLYPGGVITVLASSQASPAYVNDPCFRGHWFNVSRVQDLPSQFRDIKLLNNRVSPAKLLYLFDIGFSLNDISFYYLKIDDQEHHAILRECENIVNSALDKYEARKQIK